LKLQIEKRNVALCRDAATDYPVLAPLEAQPFWKAGAGAQRGEKRGAKFFLRIFVLSVETDCSLK
jgi:hypothetical protein